MSRVDVSSPPARPQGQPLSALSSAPFLQGMAVSRLGGFVPHPSLSRKPGVPGRGELRPPCGHRARPRALSPAGEPSQGTASGRSASHRAPATLHGLSPAAAIGPRVTRGPEGPARPLVNSRV